jgi:peptidoglycan/xylan/chitin deacetylase (PgdA/CDA1 family)
VDTLNVVYYHHVGRPESYYKAFYSGCTLKKFSDDLLRLSRVFDFAPLSKVLEASFSGQVRRRPLLAVTFDDGFDLCGNGIMEVLDEYNVKATTFIITSCIDNRRLMWRHALSAIQGVAAAEIVMSQFNELAAKHGFASINQPLELMKATRLWDNEEKDAWTAQLWEQCKMPPVDSYLAKERPYFTLEGLRAWISKGHTVGFHTHTHPYCSRLKEEDLDEELIRHSTHLGRVLGISDLYFSYPFGARLSPLLEARLLERKVFSALFGIDGLKHRGQPYNRLERVGLESSDVGWSVFAPLGFAATRFNWR